MDKYSIPNLPSTQHILEDLSDTAVIKVGTKMLSSEEDILQNVYQCYMNFKQLESDQVKQNNLNIQFADLNQKLADNISNMKTQAITKK